jgi:hypothetical protein
MRRAGRGGCGDSDSAPPRPNSRFDLLALLDRGETGPVHEVKDHIRDLSLFSWLEATFGPYQSLPSFELTEEL